MEMLFLVWALEFPGGYCDGDFSLKGNKMSILSCAIACRDSPFFTFANGASKCDARGYCRCDCYTGVNGKCAKKTDNEYTAFKITDPRKPG